jgi:DDE domain
MNFCQPLLTSFFLWFRVSLRLKERHRIRPHFALRWAQHARANATATKHEPVCQSAKPANSVRGLLLFRSLSLQYFVPCTGQDGDVIAILVQPRRNQSAAERFFRKLLRGQGAEPLRIITDKLRSYSAAMRNIFGDVTHIVDRYANNRAERSHISQPANGNGKWADSNLLGTRNDFPRSTMLSGTSSNWAGTYCDVAITGCCDRDPSRSGKK